VIGDFERFPREYKVEFSLCGIVVAITGQQPTEFIV
jgi:hypothetical protein